MSHIATMHMGRHDGRAYPDLNQGPADLQPAVLTTEIYTHIDTFEVLGYFPLCARSPHGSAIWAARQVRLSGTRRKAFWGRLGWFGVSLGAVLGSAHQFSRARGGHGSLCATVSNRSAGWRDWRSPDTHCCGHAHQHQCHHAELCMFLCTSTISEKECSY